MPSLAASPALPGLLPTPLSGGLKRKRIDNDGNDTSTIVISSQPPSSPSKRPKVRFNLSTDVVKVDPDKPFELVREEIRRALEEHGAGEDRYYTRLQDLFVTNPTAAEVPNSRQLRKYIVALTSHVRLLNKKCSSLVKVLLESDWLGRDDAYVSAYIRFLGTLVSAHGNNLRNVLEMLVGKFVDPAAGQVFGQEPVQQLLIHERVHQALKSLLDLVPTANASLSRVLADNYPFSKDSIKTHITYVTSVLKVIEYSPEMRNFILGLLTERILKLDLEIQEDLDEDFEERADEVMHEILARSVEAIADDESDSEPDVSDDGNANGPDPHAELTEEQRKFIHFKESVEKLDALLDLLFNYYDSIFQKGASYDATDIFEHMAAQFKHNILPTHHSRYTQFLLFHFAQSNDVFTDRFVEVCWAVVEDKGSPVMLRLAASSYLGSFIARGARVSADLVRYSVELLVTYLNEQRLKFEAYATGPDLHRFASFYATFQVLMYIFCFRWQDLLENDNPHDPETIMDIVYHDDQSLWFPGLKEAMSMAMLSILNPFKICAPGIIEQFVKVADNFNFLTADHIIRRNRTIRIVRPTLEAQAATSARETALSGSLGDSLQLDDYFPFDPYYLPKSKRWLDGDYVEWQAPEGLKDDADEDDNSGDRDSSEDRQLRVGAQHDDEDLDDESESEYESD